MPVILSPHSGLSEVLWKFSHFKDEDKCLALMQNPHFYERLPRLSEAYRGEFQMDPIETFQYRRIGVLVDNPDRAGRVFLEIAGQTRAFGNVWNPNGYFVFKGSCPLCFVSPSLTPVRYTWKA